ncbi:MAG: autotransporter outer membrane beta-barrel domain-containing protein [Endomicrobiaceae bacterium]|nr:autotransporter outer membrane beta-barrel domain-containing protein [Endomicrobiaceae bacterium]
MNLKKFVVSLILGVLFIPAVFVYAEDLTIEGGKTYKIDFRGDNKYDWYNDKTVYGNVNIGNATKVVLDSELEYVFVDKKISTEPFIEDVEVPGEEPGTTITERYKTYMTTYTYRNDEVLATLSISQNGTLTLNSGSELSIRNQCNLVTNANDSSLAYEKTLIDDEERLELKEANYVNKASVKEYKYVDTEGNERTYTNKGIQSSVGIFTGDIVFAAGDTDTKLTFRKVSNTDSKEYILPQVSTKENKTEEEPHVYRIDKDNINDVSKGIPEEIDNRVTMVNNFRIDSTRAVLNVEGGVTTSQEWSEVDGAVTLIGKDFGVNSYITGDGCIVKSGAGTLNLGYLEEKDDHGQVVATTQVDATGLTGKNNDGFGWVIEDGRLSVHNQKNLGSSAISISGGCLAIRSEGTTLSNKIEFVGSKGAINLAQNSNVTLTGEIATDIEQGGIATFNFYDFVKLKLQGKNTAKQFNINYGGEEGGAENYLITKISGLATDVVSATNKSGEEFKDYANFELSLTVDEEDEIKEYAGSFEGDMYLRKTGNGIMTLSGESSHIGTYITEGGILLSASNALGTGKIIFDGGVKGDTTTYASIGVSSNTSGAIELSNNIHVGKGAIINVAENQKMILLGDLVNSNPNDKTEFIKNGLGEATIAEITDKQRNINISSFTVTEGGFVLDKNVVLDSYFALDGEKAYLKMNENAGVKNDIDINSGDLIIFNQVNLSSCTNINFNNISMSTGSFSKFHITSTTVLSDDTILGTINIAKNIEFVNDATTTVNLSKFNFGSGEDTVIVKSGEGNFIADNNSDDFEIDSLYVNEGNFRIENTNMTVSSTTLINGGILSISSTSHFASTAASPEIRVLSGGIGIYDDDSIDGATTLNFEGTDEENLSKLVIEAADVELTNDINVKAGINIQNDKDFTFSGNQISFDPEYAGILAKSGEGKMTINTAETFEMGELRALEGNLLVKSNINVSTISVLGENALLSFEDVESADITEALLLAQGGTLAVSTSTLTIADIALDSAIITNTSSSINIIDSLDLNNSQLSLLGNDAEILVGEDIYFTSSTITLSGTNANINAVNNIGILGSTVTLSAESVEISALNDISFESAKVNLSSDSASINAQNNIYFVNSEINLSTSADITAKSINLDASKLIFLDSSTVNNVPSNTLNLASASIEFAPINATKFNLTNGSSLVAFGEMLSYVKVGNKSYVKIGKEDTINTLKTKNVVFESGSSLYIDVNSENGVVSSDKLDVNGDITVQKDVQLYVNLKGTDYDASKEFEFLTFTGNSAFDNPTNKIFDILLNDLRFSASTILMDKSIFLKISQDWNSYDVPGLTKNQEAMVDVFNKILEDGTLMESTISSLSGMYTDYRNTGDKTEFINALQDLSGIFYANSFMTSAMFSKANIIYNRLNDYSVERTNSNNLWAQVYTNNFTVAENEENPKFENSIYGVIAGYDTVAEEDLVFGIAGFYGQGELKQLKDKADVIDAGVNVYGDYRINENINVKGLVGYSMQDYDTTRNLRFINQEIKSKYATNTINIDLEVAYRYDLGEKVSLKPLVGANCAVVSNGDIEEDGDAEQRLKIDKNSYTKADVRVGVGLQSRAVSHFNWYVSAAVKQIVVGDKFKTKGSFINAPGYDFEIESTKLAGTSFAGGLGCSYDINSSLNLSLDLNADSGSASGFGGNIGATYRW